MVTFSGEMRKHQKEPLERPKTKQNKKTNKTITSPARLKTNDSLVPFTWVRDFLQEPG